MRSARPLTCLLLLACLVTFLSLPLQAGVVDAAGITPAAEPSPAPPPPPPPPPVYDPPTYDPPTYDPPTYDPPTYNPPVYTPPVSKPPTITVTPPPVIYEYETVNKSTTSTVVKNVVQGYAAKKLAPNMLDNDWDNKTQNQIKAILTTKEENYLHSLTNMKAKTTYYVDVTSKTVSTKPLTNTSSTKTTTSVATTTSVNAAGQTVVKVTTTNVQATTNVKYKTVAKLYDASPLVLDLNRDGRIDVANNEWRPHAPKFFSQYALHFDITGDGEPDAVEWLKPDCADGILVRPEDGRVNSALQMFGTAGGYGDGFEKLSLVQDADRNGWIEGQELEGLFVWVDSDSNGVFQPEELHSLSEYGITRLSTRHQDYVGTFVDAGGQRQLMWDWWPATLELRKFATE